MQSTPQLRPNNLFDVLLFLKAVVLSRVWAVVNRQRERVGEAATARHKIGFKAQCRLCVHEHLKLIFNVVFATQVALVNRQRERVGEAAKARHKIGFKAQCTLCVHEHLKFIFNAALATQVALTQAGEWEYELDPYYSNIAYYQSLDDSPIPELGERTELDIYRDLFFRSYLPRFFLLEASINPMPLLGVVVKDESSDLYKNMNVSQDLNLVQAFTAGFEEPYALSFFLGNMVRYQSKKSTPGYLSPSESGEDTKNGLIQSKGFMGYLISTGHLHIRQNQMIEDRWWEFEWKIKGDKVIDTLDLSWSFRGGFKIHDNPLITDEFYVALKRERIQDDGDVFSWVQNGGIEFKYRMDKNTGQSIGQQLIIDKKIPLKQNDWVLSFGVGLVRDTKFKYKGKLRDEDDFTAFVFRPSLSF